MAWKEYTDPKTGKKYRYNEENQSIYTPTIWGGWNRRGEAALGGEEAYNAVLQSIMANGTPMATQSTPVQSTPKQDSNTQNGTLTSGEFWSKDYLGITPEQRQQLFYYGSNNLPTGSAQGNSSASQTQSTQGQSPQGQIQMVKGPDGRWTYKMIGQVPGAQVKATMEQVRKMNARLDEQAAAQQQTPSANRWTNPRDTSAIQRFLTMQGYNLEIDGKMGRQTQAALRDWQSKNGLKADGLWGNNTEAAAKRAESTMMQSMQTPQSSSVTVESRTMPAYAGTTATTPDLALSYKIGQDTANGVGMFANGKLFGNQPLSPLEEAAQYQKRGGCMYKRGKRIK